MTTTTLATNRPPCLQSPRAGAFKGKPCLRPEGAGHPGACVYDPDKLQSTLQHEEAGRPIPMTEEEMLNGYTAAQIRERAQAIDEAQTVWEQVRNNAMPKILCPQCNGNGRVTGGSLGEFCDRCNGSRTVQDMTVEFDFAMPDFAELRAGVSRYADAHALRDHGVRAALPERSSVPSMEEIRAVTAAARRRALELGPGRPAPDLPRALPDATAGESGGIEDTATDAELVELEDDKG